MLFDHFPQLPVHIYSYRLWRQIMANQEKLGILKSDVFYGIVG